MVPGGVRRSSPGQSRRMPAVFLATLIAVGACSPASPPPPSALTGIRAMLEQRASSLLRGDVAGYLQPLGPGARAVEEPIARGAISVALSDISFVFIPKPDVDTEAPVIRAVPIDLVFTYKALPPDNRFALTYLYDIERQGPSWVITRSQPDVGTLPIWATGPVQVGTSPHFLALSRPGLGNTGQALALAEQANSAIVPKLALETDPVHLLVLARDHRQLEEVAGRPEPTGVLALADFTSTGEGVGRQRQMIVDMTAVLGAEATRRVKLHESELTPGQVFQHELGHLALSRYFSTKIPGWVKEGAAMYLSGERRTLSWSEGAQARTFDALSFVELSKSQTLTGADGYAYANAAVLYLVQTFGPERFWGFYSDFARRDEDAIGLLTKDYGIDEPQLDNRTRAWIASPSAR